MLHCLQEVFCCSCAILLSDCSYFLKYYFLICFLNDCCCRSFVCCRNCPTGYCCYCQNCPSGPNGCHWLRCCHSYCSASGNCFPAGPCCHCLHPYLHSCAFCLYSLRHILPSYCIPAYRDGPHCHTCPGFRHTRRNVGRHSPG